MFPNWGESLLFKTLDRIGWAYRREVEVCLPNGLTHAGREGRVSVWFDAGVHTPKGLLLVDVPPNNNWPTRRKIRERKAEYLVERGVSYLNLETTRNIEAQVRAWVSLEMD
jgi:hypothetical protein